MNNSLNQSPFNPFIERVQIGNYRPGDDPLNRLAVAIDGGGMSTIHNVGMARVLEDNGVFDVSEMVVGISAGAKLAASIVSGQLSDAEEMFKHSLVNRKFINMWRLFGGGKVPVLNLPLLEEMITIEKPLNTSSIERSSTELGIGVTDLTNFLPVVVSSRKASGSKITDATMRSVHMPWVAGAPKIEDGIAWGDGGLSWMTTSDIAKELGATKIVELSNNPQSKWKNHNIYAGLVSLWIHRYVSAESAKKYREFTKKQVDYINHRSDSSVEQIYPIVESEKLPGTLCQIKSLLQQGYNIGQETARAALGFEAIGVSTHPEARRSLQRTIGRIAASSRSVIPLSN